MEKNIKQDDFPELSGASPEELKEAKVIAGIMQEWSRAEQQKKVKNLDQLNQIARPGGILFTGSSLMEQFPVCEMCLDAGITAPVYNRGIGGFTTTDFLENIGVQLLDLKPAKVFINIGTNDMNPQFGDDWMEKLLTNYRRILSQCKKQLPDTEVYMMAYYPVNSHLQDEKPQMFSPFTVRTNENIALVNKEMEKLAGEFGYHFINVNGGLTDEHGDLKKDYTIEGIHMYTDAYKQVFANLKPYLV